MTSLQVKEARALINNHRWFHKHIFIGTILLSLLISHGGYAKVFNAATTTLENGMQVIVVENHRAPVVTHMIWYGAGAADEPQGKSGIAHFLEHLLFKGQDHPISGKLEAGEFSRIVRRLGGEDNAFTSQDYTAYYQSIASEHLEKVMKMKAGRMRGVSISEKDFEAEKKVIQEERRQRTDNNPTSLLFEQMREALHTNHPYGTPVIGWMHEILDLEWTDAKQFYDLYYAPNNAVLIVSGDVKPETVFELARQTYGTIPKINEITRERTKTPPLNGKKIIIYEHENAKQTKIAKMTIAPSFIQNKKSALALELLSEILGNGSTSKLYKALVIDQKIFTSISLSYNSSALDSGHISITGTSASPEYDIASLEKLEKSIDHALSEIVKNGISEQDRIDAIKRMQAEAVYALDSLSGPAMIIGYNMMTGSTLDDIENWPKNIEKITLEDLNNVLKQYIDPSREFKHAPVIGFFVPQKTSETQDQKQ